jgi:hypothetical protein
MKPEPQSRTAPKRDPAKMASGKIVFLAVIAKKTVDGLTQAELENAIFYLDGSLFMPAGGGKASRMLRDEAKRRGVL